MQDDADRGDHAQVAVAAADIHVGAEHDLAGDHAEMLVMQMMQRIGPDHDVSEHRDDKQAADFLRQTVVMMGEDQRDQKQQHRRHACAEIGQCVPDVKHDFIAGRGEAHADQSGHPFDQNHRERDIDFIDQVAAVGAQVARDDQHQTDDGDVEGNQGAVGYHRDSPRF